jgi:hypothetical protein
VRPKDFIATSVGVAVYFKVGHRAPFILKSPVRVSEIRPIGIQGS